MMGLPDNPFSGGVGPHSKGRVMRPITASIVLVLLVAAQLRAQIPVVWSPAPAPIYSPGRPHSHHGYLYGSPYVRTVVIVVNPAPVLLVNGLPPDVARFVSQLPEFPPPAEREILANIIPPVPAPKPAPLPKPDFAAPPGLLAPPPAADQNEESERQVKLGRESFASGQVGLAAQQFQKAINAAPKRALPYFLLAQAQYAVGRYREAVVAVLAGLKLEPNWPATLFDPRDLYEGNAADFALDLEKLHQAADRSPEEPALSFLYGYELWLNGRRDEARKSFERTLVNSADPAPIRLFLNSPAR